MEVLMFLIILLVRLSNLNKKLTTMSVFRPRHRDIICRSILSTNNKSGCSVNRVCVCVSTQHFENIIKFIAFYWRCICETAKARTRHLKTCWNTCYIELCESISVRACNTRVLSPLHLIVCHQHQKGSLRRL